MHSFIEELNPSQREAATTFEGPMLILAGAGSGKTKTLVARVANMVASGIEPSRILCLTFSVKAANEMRERGEQMLLSNGLGFGESSPKFSNFHSLGYSVLREMVDFCDELKPGFSVCDESGQKQIIKQEIKYIFGERSEFKERDFLPVLTFLENSLSDYSTPEAATLSIRNILKKNARYLQAEKAKIESLEAFDKVGRLYWGYKKKLRANNLADFDDLINLVVRVGKKGVPGDILGGRYDYIMVDEFQDTNQAQIEFVDVFLGGKNNICVVGDNDQGIYGWRGADTEEILQFHKKRGAKVINLNINYRSGRKIISAANEVIKDSIKRAKIKKPLEAHHAFEGSIVNFSSYDSVEEGKKIVSWIKSATKNKVSPPSEIAVLSRTNGGLREVEKGLILEGVPYAIVKGRGIFKTKGFQEFMAFVSFFANPENGIALELALTSTAKLLPLSRVKHIVDYCEENGIAFAQFMLSGGYRDGMGIQKRYIADLDRFMEYAKKMQAIAGEPGSAAELVDTFPFDGFLIQRANESMGKTNSDTTREALERLLDYIRVGLDMLGRGETVADFVNKVSIAESADMEEGDRVKLMTIHAAKGLEFENVFVVQVNEGIIPHATGLMDEEERLFYVAVTRAKNRLFLSTVQRIYGKEVEPSSFLEKIRG